MRRWLQPIRYLLSCMVIFAFSGTEVLHAQSSAEHFGKNRIQNKRFDWTYYKTENFEIYFYKEGSEIARFAALHAEEEYKRISKTLGYAPFGKTKLLLYNSQADLLQSNIGLDDEVAFVGGQTNFVKLNAELAFDGNLIDYKNDISTAIAKIYITDLLYGGNVREVYQNSLLMNLPDWFIPGAAAYAGRGWSLEMDDYLRDVIFKYKLKNPAKFRGKESELLGASIFNYIVVKYGEPQMANIISYARMMRSDREAIESTLDISYKEFMKGWKAFYKEIADSTMVSYKAPSKDMRIKKRNHRGVDYNKVKISPDGKQIAYTQNLKGRYSVKATTLKKKNVKVKRQEEPKAHLDPEPTKLSDIDRALGIEEDSVTTRAPAVHNDTQVEKKDKVYFARKRTLVRGGTTLVNQKVNYNVPLIAWKNNNHLAVLVKKKNRHILRTYNAKGRRKSKIKIYNFNQILDFNYSPDDNFIVLSAERNGQSDIFEYDTRRATTRIITNDMYDDLYPIYQKGTKNLIWSSNRHNDTLGVDIGRFRLLGSNLDLFKYEPDSSSTVLKRLTNTPEDETKPVNYGEGKLVYLSDKNGVQNAYLLQLADTLNDPKQVTANAFSFRDLDANSQLQGLAYVSVHKGKERVHYEPLSPDADFHTPKTERQLRVEELKQKEEQQIESNRKEAVRVVEEKERKEKEEEKLETLVDAIMNGSMSDSAITKMAQDTVVNVLDLDSVQTETFVFESEKSTLKNSKAYFANRLGVKSDRYYLYKSDFQAFAAKGGLWQARNRLGVENTVTSIMYDPLRGFGVVMNATLADIFNNHRFYAGMFGSSDLRTSNMYFEYQFLKRRIDFRLRYEKQRFFQAVTFPNKYTVNKWELEMAYPFTNTFRVSFTPIFMNSRFNFVWPILGTPDPIDRFTSYTSYRAEAVFDNTLITGHNMQEGTKFRLLYEYNYALENIDDKFQRHTPMDFGRVALDARRYQRIHQELILAVRVSAGSFVGPAKKNFLIGGMDNWMGNNTVNTEDPTSPLYLEPFLDKRDLLFNKYITNLRGFSYNQLFGSNHLVMNAEIRWPIVKYFYRGVIGSNFFKNLQLTGFYDIGSAWSGTNPWDSENSFNTRTVSAKGNSFSAKVINYRNPWLQGYGTGIRTMFLGYYLKVDLAWGVMDYVVQKPKWYVTLGYDF